MGMMSELYIMLRRGDTVEEITDWLIKINMERDSHITMSEAKITAQENYNKFHRYATVVAFEQEIDAEHYYSQQEEE